MLNQFIILLITLAVLKLYVSSEFEVVDVTESSAIQLYDTPDFEDLILFFTKESAMRPFECKELWQFQDFRSILKDFERKCFNEKIEEMEIEEGRYPFVVIESNNKTHRNLLSKTLAERFAGKVIYNPPECLIDHASVIKEDNPLYRAFSALGMYAAAHSTKANYLKQPVIVSGYWNYAAALALDEILPNKTEPPPVGSELYDFPKDLMLPDITLFVNIKKTVPNNEKYKWMLEEEEQKPRWMTFMLSMTDHPIEVIDSCIEDKTIVPQMEQIIDKLFIYEEK